MKINWVKKYKTTSTERECVIYWKECLILRERYKLLWMQPEFPVMKLKKMWLGIIFLSLRIWKNWLLKCVPSVSDSLAQRNVVSARTDNRFLDLIPEEEGRYKIFDINLRQGFFNKETLQNSFEKCNILKINDEELITVSRLFGFPGIDLQDKCWIMLAKYDLKMLILTCGVNGVMFLLPVMSHL